MRYKTSFEITSVFGLLMLLSFMGCIVSYAQNIQLQLPEHCEVYVCKNMNKTVEKLYLGSYDKSKIYYTHSNNPNKVIPLKIVQSNEKDEKGNFAMGSIFWVQFPNSPAKYKLETDGTMAFDKITCTNPDGSVQVFDEDWGLAGAYGTYKKVDGTAFLSVKNTGNGKVSVMYASKDDGFKWQTLKVENTDMGDMGHLRGCSVRFPKIIEDEYLLKVETDSNKPHLYEITVQHASMMETPEKYIWINK
jgi:hypothetical protein